MAKLIPGFRAWFTLQPSWSRDSDDGLHYSQVDPGIQTVVSITAKLILGFRPWFTLQPSWSRDSDRGLHYSQVDPGIQTMVYITAKRMVWVGTRSSRTCCDWSADRRTLVIGQGLNRLFLIGYLSGIFISDWAGIEQTVFWLVRDQAHSLFWPIIEQEFNRLFFHWLEIKHIHFWLVRDQVLVWFIKC